MQRRQLSLRLAILVASALLSVTVVEIALRFWEGPDFRDRLFRRVTNSRIDATANDFRHEAFAYTLRPNRTTRIEHPVPFTVETDAEGFRTGHPTIVGDPTERLLLIGDSMFFGMGVEAGASIPARLAERGPREVIDYALPGYNPFQYVALAERMVPRYEPNRVVVGLFIGNDLLSVLYTYFDDEGHLSIDEAEVARWRDRFVDELALPTGGATAIERLYALSLGASRLRYRLAETTLDANLSLLRSIETVATQHGAQLTVAVIPTIDAVEGGALSRWTGSLRCQNRYVATLRASGLDVVDLSASAALRDAGAKAFSSSRHPNADGNAIIAAALDAHWSREATRSDR